MQISISIRLGLLLIFIFVGHSYALKNRSLDPLDFLIPTSFAENEKCRNHSLMYREELAKYTVWAIDMFDSTTKFPTGVFFGSNYDTGNFDECISVHLPESIGFSGQHCMAHYKINSFKTMLTTSESFKYEKIYNLTVWEKIEMFAKDRRKKNRNDMYISYCIPSSCSFKDLEIVLKKNIDLFSKNLSFTLDVDIDKRNCQTDTELKYTNGDKIFMGIVGVLVIFEVICTSYHLFTKLEVVKFSGKLHDVLKAFSYSHSIKKLMSTSYKEDGLECLDGLKVLSTFLVILGHRLMYSSSSSIDNPVFLEGAYENIGYCGSLIGPIVVDTFFTVSGFLACYYLLSDLQQKEGKINYIFVYLHRLVRLTPTYVAVLGFYLTIFVHLGNGPFWSERVGVEQERCIESWWTNLLYINNYVKVEETCMFQTWYISSDMQFFLFVPFLSYMLWKKPKTGIMCCIILISAALIVNFMVIYINEEDPFILLYFSSRIARDPVTDPTYQRIHIPSHMRASPYFTGVLAAFLKFKIRNSGYKIPQCMGRIFWIIFAIIINGLQVVGFSFYSPTESKDYMFRGLFGAAHHFLWGIAIAWCIIAVSERCGQMVVSVLNLKLWTILSKITYSTFLCHAIVQLYTVGVLRSPMNTGIFNFLRVITADIIFSYAFGFCVSLVFESPILQLEKILFRKDFRKPMQKTNSQSQVNCDVIKCTTSVNEDK